MTRTVLGNMILRDEEIYTTVGSITILRTGERVPTKEVLRVLHDCEACKRPIVDRREVPFCRQTGVCYQCCTGNTLDFCHRTICRTLPTSVVGVCKEWLQRLCPSTSSFREQFWNYNQAWTELHWSYEPWEGFIRVGYDIFCVLSGGLTRQEINASLQNSIYKGLHETMHLTKPRFLEMRSATESGDSGDADRIQE